jgi:serine/threonine protein kinase
MGCSWGQTHGVDLGPATEKKGTHLILGRYVMGLRRKDILGRGAFAICRQGVDTTTGQRVAIKIYKKHDETHDAMTKFCRQVSVLQELQEPFSKPVDPSLWSSELDTVQPCNLFMRLIDYSKDENGEPGCSPNSEDNQLYIVTEMAQYSLQDLLVAHRGAQCPLPKDIVMSIAKAIIVAVAGLHAKGFVHLDLKPSNLMVFDGHLKLIDVDGCFKVGTALQPADPSISFSPYYCAPEWAQFMIQRSDAMSITPSLDVWSAGMTICEVVSLEQVLKPKWTDVAQSAISPDEASYQFMMWLAHITSLALPACIHNFDSQLSDLLSSWLLVCKGSHRRTLAQCLAAPFLAASGPMTALPSQLPHFKVLSSTQ